MKFFRLAAGVLKYVDKLPSIRSFESELLKEVEKNPAKRAKPLEWIKNSHFLVELFKDAKDLKTKSEIDVIKRRLLAVLQDAGWHWYIRQDPDGKGQDIINRQWGPSYNRKPGAPNNFGEAWFRTELPHLVDDLVRDLSGHLFVNEHSIDLKMPIHSFESYVAELAKNESPATKNAHKHIESISSSPPSIKLKIDEPINFHHSGLKQNMPVNLTVFVRDVPKYEATFNTQKGIKLVIPYLEMYKSESSMVQKATRILIHELTHAFDLVYYTRPPDYWVDTSKGQEIEKSLYYKNKQELNAFLSEIIHSFSAYMEVSDMDSIRELIDEFIKTDFRVKEVYKYLPNEDIFWKRLYKALYAFAQDHPEKSAKRHLDRALKNYMDLPKSGHSQSDFYTFLASDEDAQAYVQGGNRSEKMKRLNRALMQTVKTASRPVPIDSSAIKSYVIDHIMKPISALKAVMTSTI